MTTYDDNINTPFLSTKSSQLLNTEIEEIFDMHINYVHFSFNNVNLTRFALN